VGLDVSGQDRRAQEKRERGGGALKETHIDHPRSDGKRSDGSFFIRIRPA
jgi:hypothetical protein